MFAGDSDSKKSTFCNIFHNITKKHIKLHIFLLIFAFLFLLNNIDSKNVYAENDDVVDVEIELNNATSNILDNMDFSELENYLQNSQFNYSFLNNKTFKEFVVDVVNGEEEFGIKEFFIFLINSFKSLSIQLLSPLLSVFIIILLATLFNNLRGRKISGVSEIIYLVCFAGVVLILSYVISGIVINVKDSISNVQNQMNILFPILITLMTGIGGVATASAYSPLMAMLSFLISKIFFYILFPLFSLSLILSIVGNISENVRLTKFNGFLKSSFKWILGIVCSVFLAYLSVKSVVQAGKDGLSIKATKYAIKNYIPMLGGYISDGFQFVKAGGLIVKNAVGFVGIILIVGTCIIPVLSVGVMQLGLKFLSGVVEPLGDDKSAKFFLSISDSLKMLLAIIIGIAIMYFFTLYLMISSLSGVL